MEFHVSRIARDRYQFDQTLFSLSGNIIFANFHAARLFAKKMNDRRDLVRFPEQAVRAGQINAMGMIDEILHMVIHLYYQQNNPTLMQDALDWLDGIPGKEAVDATLREFAIEFPPVEVYQRQISIDEYLESTTEGVANRQVLLEELLLLWLANTNPAFAPFQELFDDTNLDKLSAYRQVIPSLHAFFETQAVFGPDDQNLIDMLRSPAIAVPHSLPGQIEYIRQKWAFLLGKYLYRLLGSLDFLKEEEKAIFLGPGPSRAYDFTGLELEVERFSPDKDWMPHLVLIAKNTYVWLDQLSKKYHRPIFRLDNIPDEELDTLSKWGFTGLWLIGVWERSAASKRIKQIRGNPDAVSSAYSLYDYHIARELGGEEAYQSLRDRAWKRGLRLASDMVPNHMSIDSRWVMEHPDWFISLEYSPFPSYSFNGVDLSPDNQVGIYLEDHYYDGTDAAVVFKRVDNWSGNTRYIYHGNDGTNMPWNDTAQLNYLISEVREAVIQTILHVARQFPIIRFDAAMTLAKKHYQRLWFPEPGTGGAIPSRAEHGLAKEQFDALITVEFWREVVDRVAQEMPDTLLLAEAFWLMEGYFVRTLGMHRVYNSAFMNMLRDEKNAEYRLVIKNTLEFDPEILKRYVNFMNNPDERTAVDQFGKGDKYFGICTMLATMPGLPMVGHGQVEGYTEKYGMEYHRAYWDETPDPNLVSRHEQQIFPLFRRRYLFAEVSDFLLYDFFSTEGFVNEDVFAYSNRRGNERALVIYHNKFASVRGWIRSSAAYSVKTGEASERSFIQKNLGEGLGLSNDEMTFCIFRDQLTGLDYIHNNRELHQQGLYIELEAYKCHVFLDFRQVQDNLWHQYAQLASYLNGRGVPSIDDALREIFLQPIHYPFHELVNPGMFEWAIANRLGIEEPTQPNLVAVLDEVEGKMATLVGEIKRLTQGIGDETIIAHQVRNELKALLTLPLLDSLYPLPGSRKYKQAMRFLNRPLKTQPPLAVGDLTTWGTLLGWLFTHKLGMAVYPAVPSVRGAEAVEYAVVSRSWIDEWLLGKLVGTTLLDAGLDEHSAGRAVEAIKIMVSHQHWYSTPYPKDERAFRILENWLKDADIQRYLGINRYQGVLWFNKESFEHLLWWMYVVAVIDLCSGINEETGQASVSREILACFSIIQKLGQALEYSGYQIELLLEAAKRIQVGGRSGRSKMVEQRSG